MLRLELAEVRRLVPGLRQSRLAFALPRYLTLAMQPRHEDRPAVADELPDLHGEDFDIGHLLVEELDDALSLRRELVGDEEQPQAPLLEVLLDTLQKRSISSGREASSWRSSSVDRRVDGSAPACWHVARFDAHLLRWPVHHRMSRVLHHLPDDFTADARVGAPFDLHEGWDTVLVEEEVVDGPAGSAAVVARDRRLAPHEYPAPRDLRVDLVARKQVRVLLDVGLELVSFAYSSAVYCTSAPSSPIMKMPPPSLPSIWPDDGLILAAAPHSRPIRPAPCSVVGCAFVLSPATGNLTCRWDGWCPGCSDSRHVCASHSGGVRQTGTTSVDLERLFKLRLVVARHGEMDLAKWWNSNGMLGRRGAIVLERGFPRTHFFAQARAVLAIASTRCAELYDLPGSMTLWKLPAELEDRFEMSGSGGSDDYEAWTPFFERLQGLTGNDLLEELVDHELVTTPFVTRCQAAPSAEGRSIELPEPAAPLDDVIASLAAAFARSEPGTPLIPYVRLTAVE